MQLKQGLASPPQLPVPNVIDFDAKLAKPKTAIERIQLKSKVAEYREKTRLFLQNQGDGELTFEDHEKLRKKTRKPDKSKSKSRKRKTKRENRSEDSQGTRSQLNMSEDKVNKSALKNRSKLFKSTTRKNSKKAVRIRQENESVLFSPKANGDSRNKKKIQFNLDPDLFSDEEKKDAEEQRSRKNKKKKIRQAKAKRRKTHKLPKDEQFGELKKRMSVRV